MTDAGNFRPFSLFSLSAMSDSKPGGSMNKAQRADVFLKILRDLKTPITEHTKILDLGCGAGLMVQAGRDKGLQFFGCGFNLRDDFNEANRALIEQGVLREISEQPYHIPFEDGYFDVVLSDQVFEHVMDYPTTLREIQRVLKPGGAFLHVFPARYRPIEPHILVPLASMLRARWWLRSWALFGIRNQFQKTMSAEEATEANWTFLTNHTNYLPKPTLQQQFSRFFSDVQFVEKVFLKHSRRGRKVYRLSGVLPFLPKVYSAVGTRVAYGRRGE